ncbi:membrane-associated phospholipid phosphatase [Anseongella ginsenosidimutans]|uniref:Membrane-associated phospholipid phosphatase n=1 Tax=Anseongella ginsenosidimutans TaxID=496056 RepID=A0A4R3KNX4_9SPHI|nr:phosphatase PAP2 family protein [Anseongella ginsenosidimutans]QEC52432.1 phosphatase PAP2 family protein [Anseongella ginsenosidimutans]TCS85818.1 membrane-associated phospholipid phosphatase [Anseongella ginsenosidimutans]
MGALLLTALSVETGAGSPGAPVSQHKPALQNRPVLQDTSGLQDRVRLPDTPGLQDTTGLQDTHGMQGPRKLQDKTDALNATSSSSPTAPSRQERPLLNDFLRFADASLYTWSGPLRWDGRDWIKLGGTIAGTTLLALADQPVRDFWHQRSGPGWEAVETAGFHYGKPYAAFALTGGFYLSGIIFKNEWARETGLILGSAFLTSAAIQTIMKTAVGRARPGTNIGNGAFKPFSDLPDYHSFPSGHMQVALATALVLGRRVEHPVLKVFFYAAAGSTFISRMHSDAHWISDLAFGGAISWFCADAVIRRMEYNKSNDPFRKKQRISWQLAPSVSGFALKGTF